MIERVLHFLKALVVFAILLPTAVAATLSVAEVNGLGSAYAQPPLIKIIRDDATGGDCTSIGRWNAITKTCRLTTNLFGTFIRINSDGITLNCQRHTITGSGDQGTGIGLSDRRDVTIKNCIVENFETAILMQRSHDNNLRGNTASDNGRGIILDGAGNTLIGNIASNNDPDEGILIWRSNHSTLIGNTANSNGEVGITFDGAGNTLIGNTANSNRGSGIVFERASHSNTLESNTASNNSNDGIFLRPENVSGNTMEKNRADENKLLGFRDQSTGSGTAGTANIYIMNRCSDNVSGGSRPSGLCNPQR
jgi:parallel beta-helix repeat protein